MYKDKKIPLQVLADALGSDVVTLLLEWPSKKYDLFVSTGVPEEREYIKNVVTEGEKLYVIDCTYSREL